VFIALPMQLLMYLVYPVLYAIWKAVVYKAVQPKTIPKHDDPQVGAKHTQLRDGTFHANIDNHGAYSHFGLFVARPEIGKLGLERLITTDGRFLRKWELGELDDWCPSGDVVSFWAFAFALLPDEMKPVEALERAVKSYIKHLGALGSINKGEPFDCSKRSGSFGVLKYGDGWVGPASGLHYYTSVGILALAAKHLSWYWRPIFWLHWALYGGWYWAKWPIIYPGNLIPFIKWAFTFRFLKGEPMPVLSEGDKLGYTRDVAMKNLFVARTVFGDKSWIVKPMLYITDTIGESESALFYSMLGRELKQSLPDVLTVSAWQRLDSKSKDDRAANIWTLDGINRVKELAAKMPKL
jgi:hypothetical protein